MSAWRALGCLVAATTALSASLAAQIQTNSTSTPMGRAAMAERAGAYPEAAAQYASILRTQPASLGALVGLENVLPRLGRRAELMPLVQAALAADSTSAGILGVAVRMFAAAGAADSARKYVDRWSAQSPNDEGPYREWSEAATTARDIGQARAALDLGRERLGPAALGLERAELLQRTGDIAAATGEWVLLVHTVPTYRDGAVGLLARVTLPQRSIVHDMLQKDTSLEARQMLGLLLVEWGQPAAGASMVRAALPADSESAGALLAHLYDRLHGGTDKVSQLATAATLEAIASRQHGDVAVHNLMEAARTFADAGDERNARRLLAVVAASPSAPNGMATAASTTLLGVLLAEGKVAESEKVLMEAGDKIGPDDHDRIARRIAMAWVRAGDMARAEHMIAGDSSTAGFDLRGRLRLFRGDLAGANDLLKQAGPYDEEREQALERVSLLSLIQAIGEDSLPALGNALVALERGDSATAIKGLTALAMTLKPVGAAETRLLAATLALAVRDTAGAILLFQQADVKEARATAAAARLYRARIDIDAGRPVDARTILEQLIIDFPDSALVPEARRLRDSLLGAVPAGG